MLKWIREAPPRLKARVAGVFYLLTIAAGAVAAMLGRGQAQYADFANLIATGCYIAVTVLFYYLFKPVSRGVSLLAAFFSLLGCATSLLRIVHLLTVPIDPLVFFGFYCLLIGYLIVRSTFLPRILGVLMAFAGTGWLTFASSRLANYLSPYNVLPGLLGEGSLTLWLLVAGVNEQRWKEQARTGIAAEHRRAVTP